MAWSTGSSEGFALAATVCGDRDGTLGLGGLGGDAATQVQALLSRLNAASKAERRAQIERISSRVAQPLTKVHVNLSPRALSLLVPMAERAIAATWLQQAPAPRMGYRAERGLRHVLRAIAECGSWRA